MSDEKITASEIYDEIRLKIAAEMYYPQNNMTVFPGTKINWREMYENHVKHYLETMQKTNAPSFESA
jgi:hypothetical protein